MSFEELPADLWLSVMSYLDFKDLVRLSGVNRYLHELAAHEPLWRRLCKYHWLQQTHPEDLTWKEHFLEFHADFGLYIGCYRPLRIAWNKFNAFLEAHCPRLHKSLHPGASEEKLNSVEEKTRQKLPLDLRCSYRIHNGQALVSPGLLGTVEMPNHYRSEVLFEIDIALDQFQLQPRLLGCIPITYCIHTGFSQYVCLQEINGLQVDSVYCGAKENNINTETELFITGKDFTSWFVEYVDNVTQKHFQVFQGEIFRFYHEPSCFLRSGYIRVSVATCFLPEFSTIEPPNFLHTYQITMEMDKDAPDSEACQLETRHWIMVNENNDEDRMDGSGVVGEHPIMRPGSSFTWVSCTSFDTTYGHMKGHFVMRKFNTGNCVQVDCPTFHMKCLPHLVLE